MKAAYATFGLALAGCTSGIAEPSHLDHDRIIAVRASPPRIQPGEQSTLDVLVTYEARPAEVRGPDVVRVISPTSLADALEPGTWKVTAPDAEHLAAARAELQLAPDAPVPLVLGVDVVWPYPVTSVDGTSFAATKTVWLGDRAQNPALLGMLMSGAPMPEDDSELVVPTNENVTLFVEADDTVDTVNWLTSCGELHDADLPSAYLRVAPDQPQQGQLALVKRDDRGGVAWRVWPIRAE